MQGLTRRAILAGLMASGSAPLWAQVSSSPVPRPRPLARSKAREPIDVDRAAEDLIERAALGGAVCFALADGDTGTMLHHRFPDAPMAPASTAKVLTTGYALDHLGPAYRFVTRVLATGPLRQGRIEGDLILAGGGDPGFSSAGIVSLLEQLRAFGVREVAGRFRVWDGALPYVAEIDPAQPDHLGYNPAVSGLNLNYNRVHFQWNRGEGGYAMNLDARSDAIVPPVQMVTMSTANRSMPIYAMSQDAETGREAWTVARPALGERGSRWLPVRGTARYTGEVFRTLAARQAHPLVLPEPVYEAVPPNGVTVAEVLASPLRDVARDMLKYSTNLTAEVLGLSATAARLGQRPDDLVSSAAQMNAWAASMGLTHTSMVDHSGLGPASRTTARDMATFLTGIGTDGPLWPLLKSITLQTPTGGREPFELRAKTGTLNFVSCLVGYIRRPGGAPRAFAILTAEPERRAAIAPGDEERPAGAIGWSRRSRALQYDLVRLWAHHT